MGYAGYAPGHKVADLATPLQQYLKMVDLVASLDTLEKLTRNCAQAPAEEKFRKVRREDEPGRSEPRARSPARPARDARRRTRARSPAREPQISPRAERTPRASLQRDCCLPTDDASIDEQTALRSLLASLGAVVRLLLRR